MKKTRAKTVFGKKKRRVRGGVHGAKLKGAGEKKDADEKEEKNKGANPSGRKWDKSLKGLLGKRYVRTEQGVIKSGYPRQRPNRQEIVV